MPEDLRTSPGASLLFIGDRTLVHGSDRRRLSELPAHQAMSFVATLLALSGWQTPAGAAVTVASTTGTTPEGGAATVDRLAEHGVLESRDQDAAFADGRNWERAGWSDVFRYHRHLRLLPMIDWSNDQAVRDDVALMRRYMADESQPDMYLVVDALRRHVASLPEGSVEGVRSIRDTITGCAGSPLDVDNLAAVLSLTFGQTGIRHLPATGDHVTKTSPSGGSRHPIEAFVLLLRDVGPLVAGRYHWNVRDNTLDLIATEDLTDRVRKHVIRLRNRPAFEPIAVVILVAVCDRSMFRYRESRSYRVLHLDAGHLLQTFAYVASSLSRPSYRGYTLDEAAITEMLGLDPLRQVPMAFGCLG